MTARIQSDIIRPLGWGHHVMKNMVAHRLHAIRHRGIDNYWRKMRGDTIQSLIGAHHYRSPLVVLNPTHPPDN